MNQPIMTIKSVVDMTVHLLSYYGFDFEAVLNSFKSHHTVKHGLAFAGVYHQQDDKDLIGLSITYDHGSMTVFNHPMNVDSHQQKFTFNTSMTMNYNLEVPLIVVYQYFLHLQYVFDDMLYESPYGDIHRYMDNQTTQPWLVLPEQIKFIIREVTKLEFVHYSRGAYVLLADHRERFKPAAHPFLEGYPVDVKDVHIYMRGLNLPLQHFFDHLNGMPPALHEFVKTIKEAIIERLRLCKSYYLTTPVKHHK